MSIKNDLNPTTCLFIITNGSRATEDANYDDVYDEVGKFAE